MLSLAESLERRTGRTVIFKTLDGDWLLKLGSKEREDPIYLLDASISIVNFVQHFLEQNDKEGTLLTGGEQRIICTDSPMQFGDIARFFTSMNLKNIEAVNIIT